jgi:hypothetical protein
MNGHLLTALPVAMSRASPEPFRIVAETAGTLKTQEVRVAGGDPLLPHRAHQKVLDGRPQWDSTGHLHEEEKVVMRMSGCIFVCAIL